MILQDVMRRIENHEFAAEANLASGSKAFQSGLRNHALFRELLEHMKEPNVPEVVLRRVIELAAKQVQPAFENPFDTAFATYLAALDLQSPELVRRAAEAASRAPNCWWSADVSSRLLLQADLGQMAIVVPEHAINVSTLGREARAREGRSDSAGVIAVANHGHELNLDLPSDLGTIPTTYRGVYAMPREAARSGRRSVIFYRRRRPRRLAVA